MTVIPTTSHWGAFGVRAGPDGGLVVVCVSFDTVAEYIGDGHDADWAARICGIPADDIRALARRMAARHS